MGDLAFVVFNVPPCKKKRVRGLTQPVIKREEILGWESPRTGPGVNELTRFQIPPELTAHETASNKSRFRALRGSGLSFLCTNDSTLIRKKVSGVWSMRRGGDRIAHCIGAG